LERDDARSISSSKSERKYIRVNLAEETRAQHTGIIADDMCT